MNGQKNDVPGVDFCDIGEWGVSKPEFLSNQ